MNRITAASLASSKIKRAVTATIPLFQTAPAIIGTPAVSSATGYSTGGYSGTPPITVTQQWKLNGSNISGATGSSYTPISGDTGGTLTVTQTLTNSAGTISNTSAGVSITGGTPAIEYLGRFDFSTPSQPTFGWSGTTIRATFNGTSVSADLSNIFANNYTYTIDGGAPTIFTLGEPAPRTTIVMATGLSAGLHTVQLTRNNSTFDGPTIFYGFDFGSGTLAAPASYASPLRLEVYGDSMGSAGGITGINCGDIIAAEDAYLGFAHVATRSMGARPPTLITYSGYGIYHGYLDEPGNRVISSIYNQNGVGGTWTFPAANDPNVVIIELGTNDISNIPSLGRDPTNAELQGAYVSFANTLRGKYPAAMIVFTVGPMTFGYQTAAQASVAQLNGAGDSNVFSLIHSSQTLTGCAGHPGIAQHAVMASEIVTFLQSHGY
jgi:hypothetical protein